MNAKQCDILFLSQDDVIKAGALDMGIAVPMMEQVYLEHHRKNYVLPGKCVLRWGDGDSEWTRGRINAMPGSIGGDIQAVGIKWIASCPQNPFRHGLPRASAVIILNDPETLIPIAVMDGTVISAVRTGANTGVAAKYLARRDSKRLGLIGAGVQNRTQLAALLQVLPTIEEIRIYDPVPERREQFAKEMTAQTKRIVTPVNSAWAALEGADIYVTATSTSTPIIKSDWVVPGLFYSHVGSHECEFDAIMKMDKRVVDDWEQIKHRGVESLAIMHSQGMIDDSAVTAEIGAIVAGAKPGRESDKETVYFNTVGLGIQDVALGSAIYKRALEAGLGTKLRLWDTPFAL